MANILFANLGGSGSKNTSVMNGTAKVEIGVADDYSQVVVKETTSAGVVTVYEAPLYAEGEAPAIGTEAKIFTGAAASVSAVYAEVGDTDAVGSVYLSTAGGFYFQVADNGAEADWETVTTS